MRGIARAAAYVPASPKEGVGVAARDEDGFTVAATALERLEDDPRRLAPPTRLLLVGDLPESADTDLVRFLGFPIRVERLGKGRAGLRAAVDAAADAVHGTDPVLVVAVDLPSASEGSPPTGKSHRSDAGVALRVGEQATPPPQLDPDGAAGDDGSTTAPLLRLGRERVGLAPGAWVGDFSATPDPGRGDGTLRLRRPTLAWDGPVSQGAYIPRPRYLENLPSRWRFAAEKCGSCGAVDFPPRGQCRQCGAVEGLVAVRLPHDGGEVVAVTTIGPGGQPTEFDEQVEMTGPYGVVIVELVPGARVTLQVADARPGEIAIGSRVGTRLRRLYPMEGEWRYGRKAVPLS